ncbi:ATP-binding protein [Chroococcidiopsis sp. CCNUC1]|uniref:AAA family ATPase n=1 Tax=Chroococcidiopsis sp. CCNUC1 TaxID=2653189 RepID=UPI00201FDF64|nr:ATP-binding protein [Chroococcidiopsis sp. CCNUC1]URD53702.1 ATP-binding protein [Chroococcidiopsis sp. CCNUC1]
MNTTPRPPTPHNTALYPTEFQQLLQEKSKNFVARQFVSAGITDFLYRHDRGYFTLVGAPGSGKSAILAKYATENSAVIYYNAQVSGKNRVDQFLPIICTQLVTHYSLDDGLTTEDSPSTSPAGNTTQGSRFLSFLLQKISNQLQPNQRLIIAIDALDAIDHSSQRLASNLFYLPRYLPKRVYFLLSRRPFVREKADLFIETPSQIFNLDDYPEQNWKDLCSYIQHCLTLGEVGANLKAWLRAHHLTEEEFSQQLTSQSKNNFMYLSQILAAIASAFYSQPFLFERLPPDLEAYYQQHWRKMKEQGLSHMVLSVLSVLSHQENGRGISPERIAKIIDEDEYEVQEVLENWFEFLVQRKVSTETRYSLYHYSFQDWLTKQCLDEGIDIGIAHGQK